MYTSFYISVFKNMYARLTNKLLGADKPIGFSFPRMCSNGPNQPFSLKQRKAL